MFKAAAALSGLMKVCTFPFHDKRSLQCYVGFTELHRFSACTAGFIFETFPSPDVTCDVDNMKFDIDIKEEEDLDIEEEVSCEDTV